MIPRSAIILGAGLAGSALARALARRGWSVSLIDDADPRAGSRQPALAVHPAHAPDDSPASRLSRIGLTLLAQDAAAEHGLKPGWWPLPRLQRMSIERAQALASAWAEGPLELHEDGLLWTQPCAVDSKELLMRWQREATENDRLRSLVAQVTMLKAQEGEWQALDSDGHVIANASTAILCMGYRSATVSFPLVQMGLPDAPTNSSLSQSLQPWLTAAGWQLREGHCSRSLLPGVFDPLVVGLQGEGHQIPLPDGHLLYGPRGRGVSRPLADKQPLHPGVRVSVRDHLPLVGALPDLDALHAHWPDLRRNDRLPIPRQAGLWMLSALGGRGLLWCLPAAEHLAAQISQEASPLDARLSAALDPARFLRRALRSGVPDLTHALGLA